MIDFHVRAREQRKMPDSPPRCVNPVCGALLVRQKDGTHWQGAHGWCSPCVKRWYRAGQPQAGPPAPYATARAPKQARVAEFARMRAKGYTALQAARVMRITDLTAWKYDRQIAAGEEAA